MATRNYCIGSSLMLDGDRPSNILHAPSGRDIRMVFALGRQTKIGRYLNLRAALDSIRPVLGINPMPLPVSVAADPLTNDLTVVSRRLLPAFGTPACFR
jgi:hypothetical protein